MKMPMNLYVIIDYNSCSYLNIFIKCVVVKRKYIFFYLRDNGGYKMPIDKELIKIKFTAEKTFH